MMDARANVGTAPVYSSVICPKLRTPDEARIAPSVMSRTFMTSKGVSTTVRAAAAATPPMMTPGFSPAVYRMGDVR